MATAIKYLIESSQVYDCHFIVGRNRERIGIVRELVGKCSDVLHNMLVEGPMKEQGDVEMPDIHPAAIKILLKYAYGAADSVSGCSELAGWDSETALAVVAMADKYMVPELKKMALDQLTPSTILDLFPALHCVAVYRAASLEPAVLKIIENRTAEIFSHPDFLELDDTSLVYILRQPRLNISEVEVFKAALAWARHRGGSEDVAVVRSLLETPLQHIRLNTITSGEFWTEVVPSKIFTTEEVMEHAKTLSVSIVKQSSIFNITKEKRSISPVTECLDLRCHNKRTGSKTTSSHSLTLTGERPVRLQSLVCYGRTDTADTYYTTVTVTLSQMVDSTAVSSVRMTGTVSVKGREDVIITPELWGLSGVALEVGRQYRLDLQFSEAHPVAYSFKPGGSYCDGHDCVLGQLKCNGRGDSGCIYCTHLKQLHFSY